MAGRRAAVNGFSHANFALTPRALAGYNHSHAVIPQVHLMPSESVAGFLDRAQAVRVLHPDQVEQLVRQPDMPHADTGTLCEYLLGRGVITKFQADAIREGRAHELAFGGYPVIDVIGPCPGGTAYRALHPSLRTPLVLRRYAPGAFAPTDDANALVARARVCGTIVHPHVQALLDARACLDAPVTDQRTALHYAAQNGHQDVVRLLNAGDVYMLSSDHEGLPRSVLEALRVGLPVAATNAGGTAEVVTPGTGLVVDVGDAHGLARAVLDLLEHPPGDVRAAAAATLEAFDIHAMVRSQERLYLGLLGRPAA